MSWVTIECPERLALTAPLPSLKSPAQTTGYLWDENEEAYEWKMINVLFPVNLRYYLKTVSE